MKSINFFKSVLYFIISIFFLSNLINCNVGTLVISPSDNNSNLNTSIVFPVVESIDDSPFITENVYYVDQMHPSASDGNIGSEDCPFLTIESAYNKVDAGGKIIVKQGIYNERIKVSKSGHSNKFIIFQADGNVQIKGFLLYGNNIAVIGFNIVGDETVSPWLGGGIWIHGSNLYIADNRISDFTSCSGIEASWDVLSSRKNIHIINNHIYKCNKGIAVSGENWLVEKNK